MLPQCILVEQGCVGDGCVRNVHGRAEGWYRSYSRASGLRLLTGDVRIDSSALFIEGSWRSTSLSCCFKILLSAELLS